MLAGKRKAKPWKSCRKSAGVALLGISLFCGKAQARELFGPEAGVIPFGMGRAYSAIVDDWLSVYYNPAGLALVKRVDFQLFDLRLESNTDLIKSFSNVKSLGQSSSSSIANGLSDFFGKHVAGKAGTATQITVPNFALGFNYDVQADFDLQNFAYPQTELRFTKDLTFLAGGAISAGKRQDFRMGVMLKYMRRTGGTRSVLVSDIINNKSGVANQFSVTGTGVGGDVGLQYRLPVPGRTEVTTSFVWHDIGNTSFGTALQNDNPTAIKENMVAGLGVRFPIGGKKNRRYERRYGPTRSTNHISLAFDYSRLNTPLTEEVFAKHCHFGINLDLPILSIQLGLNQGAITYGMGFDIGIVRVAAASYGEELGSYIGQRTDRRYVVSIGSGFGFGGF